MELGGCIILIGSKFEVSSSLRFILHNASTVIKADGIIILGVCIILIDSQFVLWNSLGLILHNASPCRKANGMAVLG
jgi:hypothetical protein